MLSDRSRFRPRESRLLRDCMRPSRGVAAEVLLVGFLGIILQFLCRGIRNCASMQGDL